MKFDYQKAFPYPVLRLGSNDYIESDFQGTADFNFSSETGKIQLSVEFAISCEEILNLINENKAHYVAVVSCRETYYQNVLKSFESKIINDYSSGELRGLIEVYPYVIAGQDINGFVCDDINKEFGNGPFSFKKGQVLALDEPQAIFIDRQTFKPITSVFDIVKDENLSDAEWMLRFEQDHVQIALNAQTKEKIDNARNDRKNRAILVNSLYYSAIMQTIQTLKDTDEYNDTIWAQVFQKQCFNKSIDIENKQAYQIANQLMNYPIKRLLSYFFSGD